MAAGRHEYQVTVSWTGNLAAGTATPGGYSRAHIIEAPEKPAIEGSSDPDFRGDATRWNPEELLLASLSACHKLWYLGLCAGAGIVVTAYEDRAEGVMVEEPGGAGQFTAVVLRPGLRWLPAWTPPQRQRCTKPPTLCASSPGR